MAQVDFKMAYDKVPHSRVLKCLQVFRVADKVISIMESSMAQWKTHFSAGIKRLGSMSIRRRILQGDSFSPLLFVIAQIPLSMILRETGSGYAILREGIKLNHLLFMYDLILFAKNESQIDTLVKTIKIMEFGITKWAVLRRDKRVNSHGIHLLEGEVIVDIQETAYIGIVEPDLILNEKVWGKILAQFKITVENEIKQQQSIFGLWRQQDTVGAILN